MATLDAVDSIELSLEQKVSPSEAATLTVQSDGESGKSWIWLNFYLYGGEQATSVDGPLEATPDEPWVRLSYGEACWLRDRLKYLTETP